LTLGPRRTVIEDEDALPVAITTVVKGPETVKPAVIKKGFLDAKPKPKLKPAASENKAASTVKDEIPMLRGKKDAIGSGGPAIPDFMRLPPDEREQQYQKVKGQMLHALKPTPDMISKVAQDPALLAGFDDPEVMAAVNEIAKDPAALKKYQNNAKVLAFYKAMAGVMGEKLQKMGEQQAQ